MPCWPSRPWRCARGRRPGRSPKRRPRRINGRSTSASLIRQLGDKDYFVRERAEAELAEIGFEAFDALSEAAASEDAEVAARARYLLRLMHVEWTDRKDPPEVKKLLQDYESQDADARQSRMHRLANLPGRSGIPALCRLVRYEHRRCCPSRRPSSCSMS